MLFTLFTFYKETRLMTVYLPNASKKTSAKENVRGPLEPHCRNFFGSFLLNSLWQRSVLWGPPQVTFTLTLLHGFFPSAWYSVFIYRPVEFMNARYSRQTICGRMLTANVTLLQLKTEAMKLKRERTWKWILMHPEMPEDMLHPSRRMPLLPLLPQK